MIDKKIREEIDSQASCLRLSIQFFKDYISYSNVNHCAIPGEADKILEDMEQIYRDYFGGDNNG